MRPLTWQREQTGFSLLHLVFASEQPSQLSLSFSFARFRCCIFSRDAMRCHGNWLPLQRYRQEIAVRCLCVECLCRMSARSLSKLTTPLKCILGTIHFFRDHCYPSIGAVQRFRGSGQGSSARIILAWFLGPVIMMAITSAADGQTQSHYSDQESYYLANVGKRPNDTQLAESNTTLHAFGPISWVIWG